MSIFKNSFKQFQEMKSLGWLLFSGVVLSSALSHTVAACDADAVSLRQTQITGRIQEHIETLHRQDLGLALVQYTHSENSNSSSEFVAAALDHQRTLNSYFDDVSRWNRIVKGLYQEIDRSPCAGAHQTSLVWRRVSQLHSQILAFKIQVLEMHRDEPFLSAFHQEHSPHRVESPEVQAARRSVPSRLELEDARRALPSEDASIAR